MADEEIVIRFGPGGSVRMIHSDDFAVDGCEPAKRASHVEPIQAGPLAGQWYTDMSPLGEGFQYCLWPPLPTRREALKAEVAHVVENWVRGPLELNKEMHDGDSEEHYRDPRAAAPR